MAFEPFDLGRVIQTAEAIKGIRRQSTTDALREQFMGEQIASAKQDREMKGQQFAIEKQMANTKLLHAAAAEVSANPSAAERWIPQLQEAGVIDRGFDWQSIPPEELKAAATDLYESTTKALMQPGAIPERERIELQEKIALQQRTQQQDFTRTQQEDQQAFTTGQNAMNREAMAGRTATTNERRSGADQQKLRKEFRGLQTVKDYETALPLLVSARKAPDNGYGDLQLIYTAGKVLDPGSVVREGELALTVAAGSPLQRALGTARFTTENGGRLTPETRKQLLGMLNERVLAYRQAYDRDYTQFAEYARDSDFSPEQVVGRHAANAYGSSGQAKAPQNAGPKRIASDAEYDALPSNTEFIGPDGQTRRKP